MSKQVSGKGTKPHKWRGRWRAAVTIGYDRDGVQIRDWVYGVTQAKCQEKLDQLLADVAAGLVLEDRVTLGQWLDEWLEGQKRRIKPRSVEIYKRDIGLLGTKVKAKQLRTVKPRDLEREILHIADAISGDAANKVRATLRAALEDAAFKDLITVNPAKRVKRVEHEQREVVVWTAAEVMQFTQFTAQGRPLLTRPGEFEACHLHAFFYVALVTGARSGELICLTWDDIAGSELSINKTVTGTGKARGVGPPKSKAGKRTNTLPPDAVAVLTQHREYLAGIGLENAGLVFPADSGMMLDSSNVGRALRGWTKSAGVQTILTPHELRHTYASMAIAAGMSPVDLARQIGHADAGFTLKRYTHFFERAKRQVPPSLEALMQGGNHLENKAGSGIHSGIAPEIVN